VGALIDTCVVCSDKPAVHTHHRKLRSQGGGDEPSNLLRVCLECHTWIHANPSDAYARGLLVHSWADPALVRTFLTSDNPYSADEWVSGGHEKFETLTVTEKTWNEMAVHEGEPCPTCKRRVPHAKKASSPKTRVFSTRVPIDDADVFSELVDAASEHHGLSAKPHARYWCLLYAVTLLLQQEKGELPV
jgi:hypothetical protein